ncbi:DMT family transporter [Streptomyces sp. HNM0645]|uniref:DMT family transporter n=1 Tax=Streptomyces sp. HNM0645 TaxID=2782343 RepID=UPI0024B6A9A4|nr:DMT family transporter [Streptomyces sp. HNM0645]MDI9886520.1 DMT family transporter [Streptomyces sp. HNM0645]
MTTTTASPLRTETAAAPAPRPGLWLGPLLALAATAIWSGNFVIARHLGDAVAPVQTSFWRWVIALLAVAPFAARGLLRERQAIRRHAGLVVLAALLGVTLFNTLIYIAGQSTSATNLALIAAASPAAIAAFAFVGGERMTLLRATGMLIAFAGVVTLVSKGSITALLTMDFRAGDLWMLAAMATFAGYSALLKRKPATISGTSFLLATFAAGTVMLAPFYAASVVLQGTFTPGSATVGPLLYIGVASSAIAFYTWNKAVDLIGATRAGVIYYLQPVFVACVAYLAIGEHINLVQILCMATIVTGVALGAKR